MLDLVPPEELSRSPAAAAVGRLARESGLFLFHYEHRRNLEVPEAWVDGPMPEPPVWTDGVLPEPKYQSFRHDLPIGSYHPGHRAKWTTHELCHALVGFAWKPGATPLFHATASRLAETLPVVLWYFLDEIGLRRCPRHTGPNFRTHCPACQRAAALGPTGEPDPRRLADARRFLDAELAAVARTRRTGLPVAHVWGSIDLCSDGIAYAAGHAGRLGARSFHAWAERFLVGPDLGWHADLDALEARLLAVWAALAEGAPLAPLRGGTPRVVAWDLGQRLLQVWEETAGEAADGLLSLVDRLAAGAAPAEIAAGYRALHAEVDLPDPDDVFAVGYPIDGVATRSLAQLREGLATVTPLVLELADDDGRDVVGAFAAADRFARVPLGVRFAGWAAEALPAPIAALARFEASLRAAAGEPEVEVLGRVGVGARWVEGAIRLSFPFDVPTFAERVESGEVRGLDAPAPADGPVALVLGRARDGELLFADIPADAPAGWVDDPAALPADVLDGLRDVGLVSPVSWTPLEGT